MSGYLRAKADGWEPQHYSRSAWLGREKCAPAWWIDLDIAWHVDRRKLPSAREAAEHWGVSSAQAARLIRDEVEQQAAWAESEEERAEILLLVGRGAGDSDTDIEAAEGALFELPVSPHTHADLVNVAVRWLRGSRRCVVAFAEMGTYARVNPDAIGFTGGGSSRPTSILVECKVSRSDFRADRHKPIHTAPDSCPGQQRWYLTPPGLVRVDEVPEGWGLAEAGASRVRVVREAVAPANDSRRAAEDMRFLLSALRRHELGALWDANRGRFEGVDERKSRQGGGG